MTTLNLTNLFQSLKFLKKEIKPTLTRVNKYIDIHYKRNGKR